MSTQVNVHEAKSRLSELLARVEQGEEFTIARAGRPIARLVAVEAAAPRELGFVAGGPIPDSFFEPLPDADIARWESQDAWDAPGS